MENVDVDRYKIRFLSYDVIELKVLHPLPYVTCTECPCFFSIDPEVVGQHLVTGLESYSAHTKSIRVCYTSLHVYPG